MAKIKYTEGATPLLNEHNGYTFQPNNYGQSMFPASRSARKRYGPQWQRQHNNQKAVTQWRNMSAATKNLWAQFAATYPQPSKRNPDVFLNGYQCFIKRNSYCFLNHGIHSDFMLEPEINLLNEGSITAEIIHSESAVDCTELYIKRFGLLPQVGDYVLCRLIPYAEFSGQFFNSVEMVLQVQEIYLDGLFITVTVPDEMKTVTVSVYLSKIFHQSVRYTGTKVRYMGCFTKKRFIDLIDTPDSYAGQAGAVPVVNSSETGLEFQILPSTIVNIVNDYTTIENVYNNLTVYDINTQMFYTYINETWINVTINNNLVKIVVDYTTLVNVVNNTVVFSITHQNFFWYNVDVWVSIGGGGGGLTCDDLLDCPVILSIIENIENIQDTIIKLNDTSIPVVGFGLLYNYYTFFAESDFFAPGWRLPTRAEVIAMYTFLGGISVAGGKLKDTDQLYWSAPNTGATNETKFFGRGAGIISRFTGRASNLKTRNYLWCSDGPSVNDGDIFYLYDISAAITWTNFAKNHGCSVRGVKSANPSDNGKIGSYTCKNGDVLRTVVINDLEWIADNMTETMLQDGTEIPLKTSGNDFKNATTPRYGWPDDQERFVYG